MVKGYKDSSVGWCLGVVLEECAVTKSSFYTTFCCSVSYSRGSTVFWRTTYIVTFCLEEFVCSGYVGYPRLYIGSNSSVAFWANCVFMASVVGCDLL
jgi:hypothetical protein